jgi:hypothetical protein
LGSSCLLVLPDMCLTKQTNVSVVNFVLCGCTSVFDIGQSISQPTTDPHQILMYE